MNPPLRAAGGFTIIEIISVMIIIGFLLAVAIPKYTTLQNESAKSVAKYGVAAGMSACHMLFAETLMDNTSFDCVATNSRVFVSGDLTVTIESHVGLPDGCVIRGTSRGQEDIQIWEKP